MRSVLIAYVNEDTSNYDRVKHAVFSTAFVRIWAQFLINEGISFKHFITNNAFECLELNLILLIKLLKANMLHYIHILSSQNNESFFRCVRSYTGIESMAVNASMNSFISKTQRIQVEEKLMSDLKENISFSKIISREKKQKIKIETLLDVEIKEAIELGLKQAQDECSKLGMNCRKIDVRSILKIPDVAFEEGEDSDDDFLEITDEDVDIDGLIEENIENISVGNMQFTNKRSSESFLLV